MLEIWLKLRKKHCSLVAMPEENFPEDDLPDSPLTAFLKTVKGDSTLQEALSCATDANAVADIAKRSGVVISPFEAKLLANAMLLKQKPWGSVASEKAEQNGGRQPDSGVNDFDLAYFKDDTELRR
jgi:hypothetical protein